MVRQFLHRLHLTNIMEQPKDISITEKELNYKDGTLLYSLVVPSSPATKKNSSRIVKIKGFYKIIPSKRFIEYQKFCEPYFTSLRKKDGLPPMDFGVSIKIRVATEKWIVPDYTNICQALGDILQHYGVISNDQWIHWTDGEVTDNIPKQHWFIGVDKNQPRMEIEIRRFRHPLEFRDKFIEKYSEMPSEPPEKPKRTRKTK